MIEIKICCTAVSGYVAKVSSKDDI